jgi:hypothetical protein
MSVKRRLPARGHHHHFAGFFRLLLPFLASFRRQQVHVTHFPYIPECGAPPIGYRHTYGEFVKKEEKTEMEKVRSIFIQKPNLQKQTTEGIKRLNTKIALKKKEVQRNICTQVCEDSVNARWRHRANRPAHSTYKSSFLTASRPAARQPAQPKIRAQSPLRLNT